MMWAVFNAGMTHDIANSLFFLIAGIYIIIHYVNKMENPFDDDDF